MSYVQATKCFVIFSVFVDFGDNLIQLHHNPVIWRKIEPL